MISYLSLSYACHLFQMCWIKGNVVDAEVNFDAEPVVQYIKFLKIYLKLGYHARP